MDQTTINKPYIEPNLTILEKQFINKQEYWPEGTYTSPRNFVISRIPSVVVDPHNEVFAYWYHFSRNNPMLVLHVDNHPDLADGARACALSPQNLESYISEPGNLEIANFVSAAFYHGMVSEFDYINPRKRKIERLGSFRNHDSRILVKELNGKIKWNRELSDKDKFSRIKTNEISYKRLAKDLSDYKSSVILDIDLDAFLNISDIPLSEKKIIKCFGKLYARENWDLRMKRTLRLLKHLPKPSLITIARSQTPYLFVDVDKVDIIEETLIKSLENLYS